jgi:hypothetical protein
MDIAGAVCPVPASCPRNGLPWAGILFAPSTGLGKDGLAPTALDWLGHVKRTRCLCRQGVQVRNRGCTTMGPESGAKKRTQNHA